MSIFQSGVHDWMLECFGVEIAADVPERNHRFLEEALELVQAAGCAEAEALDEEGGFIVEAKQPRLRLARWFEAEAFLEYANEHSDDHLSEETGEDVFPVAALELADLEARVRAAIKAWQDAHGLVFTGFYFAAQRDAEYIPPKENPDDVE